MRFSQRLGITQVRAAIQGRSLDAPTRNRLWNTFAEQIPETPARTGSTWMRLLYKDIWCNHFKEAIDSLPTADRDVRDYLRDYHVHREWFEVYDLIEFVAQSSVNPRFEQYRSAVDNILKEELAGFRFLNGQLAEITSEHELHAIEEAVSVSGTDRFTPVRHHLQTALTLLSDRQKPDYRNSVKESISAVEASIQILSGDGKASFDDGLRVLSGDVSLHPALRRALLSLYGYTSDADGIRHALSEEPSLDAADAKFMLVACAGFSTLLIQKAAEGAA